LTKEQTTVSFTLYYSDKYNPSYTEEEGVHKIAVIKVESTETYKPLDERKITFTMEFSSSITITAKNEISKKEEKINVNYFNRN
jgi:hypothetical protein